MSQGATVALSGCYKLSSDCILTHTIANDSQTGLASKTKQP